MKDNGGYGRQIISGILNRNNCSNNKPETGS